MVIETFVEPMVTKRTIATRKRGKKMAKAKII